MGWLDFISNVIQALAWPAAIVALVVVLRVPLGELIGGVRTLRYKEWQADFGMAVDHVEELAKEAELPGVPVDERGRREPTVPALARKEPRAAVIESWLLVESELSRLARRHGLDGSVSALVVSGLITREVGAIIRDLRELRYRAVHDLDFRISQDEAEKYAELAQRTSEALRMADLEPTRA
jgi:hypothetical protein